MEMQGMEHTMMNPPACETPECQFIAGSGFKPKRDSFEASVHTFGQSKISRGVFHRVGTLNKLLIPATSSQVSSVIAANNPELVPWSLEMFLHLA